MVKARLLAAALGLAVATSAGAQVTTIYTNDFQTAVNPVGSLGTWTTGNGAGAPTLYARNSTTSLGQGNSDFYLSQTATLGFSGLAAYTAGTVSFDLRLWDSWDPTGYYGPDIVQFQVNGGSLLLNSSFPGGPFGGAAIPFTFNLGAGSGALNLNWISATTQTDEGWTIDNVNVTVDFARVSGVPEPSAYALTATGLLALGGLARRRRRG